MENYSVDLERAQLLADFKVADADRVAQKISWQDAVFASAVKLLAIYNTFPVTGRSNRWEHREGAYDWLVENTGHKLGYVRNLLRFAREPETFYAYKNAQKKSVAANPVQLKYNRVMANLKYWPAFTEEQQQKIIDRMAEYAHGS